MNINITDSARLELLKALEQSEYNSPALRIVYTGAG